MKKILSGLALAGFLLLPASSAFAASGDSMRANREQQSIVIGNDLYVAGRTVTQRTDVHGDFLAAGRDVEVSGNVQKQLMAAGGHVSLTGNIGDTLRAAGGNVSVAGRVGGNALLAGETVTIDSGAMIVGDAAIYADTIRINGTVHGKLLVQGRSIVLSGKVDGPIERRDNRPAMHRGFARLGAIVLGILGVFSLLSGALVILILTLIAEPLFTAAAARAAENPWWCMLWGFLYFVGVPVLAFLLLITIIGIPLGLLTGLLYLCSLFFSSVLTAMVLAKYTQKLFNKKWGKTMFFLISIVLLIALKALAILPILGWFAKCILVFIAVGALLSLFGSKSRKSSR